MSGNGASSPPGRSDESVTWVITQHVLPERTADFEEWVAGIAEDMSHYGGHDGLTVMRPGDHQDNDYVLIVRFASYEDLHRWETSPERAHWLQELTPLVSAPPTYRDETGLETWFQLPGHHVVVPPPKWKMALLILAAIYPLILIVVPVVGRLAGDVAWIGVRIELSPEYFVRTLVTAVILVTLMTWFAMPLLTRLARPWLYPKT